MVCPPKVVFVLRTISMYENKADKFNLREEPLTTLHLWRDVSKLALSIDIQTKYVELWIKQNVVNPNHVHQALSLRGF